MSDAQVRLLPRQTAVTGLVLQCHPVASACRENMVLQMLPDDSVEGRPFEFELNHSPARHALQATNGGGVTEAGKASSPSIPSRLYMVQKRQHPVPCGRRNAPGGQQRLGTAVARDQLGLPTKKARPEIAAHVGGRATKATAPGGMLPCVANQAPTRADGRNARVGVPHPQVILDGELSATESFARDIAHVLRTGLLRHGLHCPP